MNTTTIIRGTKYHVYTETRESGALALVFERGEKGKQGYSRESVPVRKRQTIEEVYSKMYNSRISADDHRQWKEKIRAIPNKERHIHPDFAYFRRKSYGVAMYFRSKWSPTGVENMGGFIEGPELEWFEKNLASKCGVAQRNDF